MLKTKAGNRPPKCCQRRCSKCRQVFYLLTSQSQRIKKYICPSCDGFPLENILKGKNPEDYGLSPPRKGGQQKPWFEVVRLPSTE